jgi:hypothetical protein
MGEQVGKSKIIELIVLGLWLMIAIILFLRVQSPTTYIPSGDKEINLPIDKSYSVKTITFVDANCYDITLIDNGSSQRIMAEFPINAVIDSKKKLIELFNDGTKPRVVLKEKKDGKWIIDAFITINGKEICVVEWMKENKLVYQ